MRAMVLIRHGDGRLSEVLRDTPRPEPGQVLLQVLACGVCRTDLHVVDGDLPERPVPIVPGDEIVGRVQSVGAGVVGIAAGDRVGVAWLRADLRRVCVLPIRSRKSGPGRGSPATSSMA